MPTTETRLKTREVAYRLGISTTQISRYVKRGDLPAQRVGKELLFNESDVSEFARSRGIHMQGSEVPQVTPFSQKETAIGDLMQQIRLNGMKIKIEVVPT